MSNIQIGKAINHILTNNEELNNMVNGNIFPLVAEETTPFPFIIYKRTSAEDGTSKDSRYSEISYVDVVTISDEYNTSVEIMDKAKEVLLNTRGLIKGFNITDITETSSDEIYYDGVYLQTIKFKIKTQI